MNQKNRLRVAAFVVLLAVSLPAAAKKLAAPGLYHDTLDNGLQLFVMENHAAPLAFVMLTVRTGAVSQTSETAGLFHLYEHMMFKGNAKYPDQAATTAALNGMGVGDWNGFTSVDAVSYYFTVPAGQVRGGLEFWSYAVRTPLMEAQEFANEKEVVVSEIAANETNPGRIFLAALNKHLFAASPWRRDSSGTTAIVRGATVAQMRDIQRMYYVPNNAAVFVGGDVRHDDVLKMVREIYGGWEKTDAVPFEQPPTKTPFRQTRKFVYGDARTGDRFVQVGYYLRGPDVATDAADTYGADMWGQLLHKPDGAFKSLLLADETLSVPDPDYVGGYYATERASGMVSLSSVMLNDGDAVQKAEHWLSLVQGQGIALFKSDAFADERLLREAKNQLDDADAYAVETAEGFLRALSSVWASGGLAYYLSYDKNMRNVTAADVRAFVEKYIEGKFGMFVVFVSPAVYEQYRAEFAAAGYETITADNAFWWKGE
ncbi:MAG: insulinase family protein [Treponemataceae bacterium]|nr:insulinase family protein [Treponemataceae bacterium]